LWRELVVESLCFMKWVRLACCLRWVRSLSGLVRRVSLRLLSVGGLIWLRRLMRLSATIPIRRLRLRHGGLE